MLASINKLINALLPIVFHNFTCPLPLQYQQSNGHYLCTPRISCNFTKLTIQSLVHLVQHLSFQRFLIVSAYNISQYLAL